MPENPNLQNPDWNADGQPQADQDLTGHHEPPAQPAPKVDGNDKDGRDRPPAGADRGRSPWMGGG
jgi:hypothetical protein